MFKQYLILLNALLTTRGEVTNLSLTTISQSFSMNTKQEADLNSHCNVSLMCSESDICPPGLFCEEGACQCANIYPFNIFSCSGTTSSSLLDCHCATWDRDRNVTLTGACVYSCFKVHFHLPQEIDKLNDKMCKPLNRTGVL